MNIHGLNKQQMGNIMESRSFTLSIWVIVRDMVCLIRRAYHTYSGECALRVIGSFDLVKNKETIILNEIENKAAVLDPARTPLVQGLTKSLHHIALHKESVLRQTTRKDR
jgi:hypothetical protein